MKSLVTNRLGLSLRWFSAYGPGTSGSRSCSGTRLPPAFKGLSHCSRTFHKYRGRTITRPIPPSSLENLRAVTTPCKSSKPLTTCTPTTPTATTTRTRTRTTLTTANSSTFPALERVSTGSAFSSPRLFSSSSSSSLVQSSTLPVMASDSQWTGVQVRKTFLDFFAERGHNVGMQPSLRHMIAGYPSSPPLRCPVLSVAAGEKKRKEKPERAFPHASPACARRNNGPRHAAMPSLPSLYTIVQHGTFICNALTIFASCAQSPRRRSSLTMTPHCYSQMRA